MPGMLYFYIRVSHIVNKFVVHVYIYIYIGKGVYYLRPPSIVLFLGAYDINIAYIF